MKTISFDPLPFDPVGPCLCHKNCPDFRKPAARYWVNVDTQGQIPRLDAGVLATIDLGSSGQSICTWSADPPFIFPRSFLLVKQPRVVIPSAGTRWTASFNQVLPIIDYLAFDVDFPDVCNFSTVILPASTAPPGWSDTTLVRIEWWQNANDVPH